MQVDYQGHLDISTGSQGGFQRFATTVEYPRVQPSKELQALRARLHELQLKNNQLEARRSELSNNVSTQLSQVIDLRQLVKVVQRERSEELDLHRSSNKTKADHKESLSAALQVIYSTGKDLDQAGRFWTEFC